MLFFSRPADHERFNATVFELIRMRFNGSVCIPGVWDANETLRYLEKRTGFEIIPTLKLDGSFFTIRGKHIIFTKASVIVTTEWLDALAINLSHLS